MCSSDLVAGSGLVTELRQFYLCFSVLGGIGRSIVQNVSPSAMVANWFLRRRTLAFSLAALAPPASSLVIPPVLAWMIVEHGWRNAWFMLAILPVLAVLPVAWFVRRRPEDMGLRPDGDPPTALPPVPAAAAAGTPAAPTRAARPVDEEWTLSEVIHSPAFWLLALGVALIQLTPQTVVVFLFSYFHDQGMSEAVSAGTISMLSLVQVSSRLFFWGPAIAKLGGVQRVTLLWEIGRAHV